MQARPREGLTPLQELEHEFADFRETMEHNPELFAVMAELMERARRDPGSTRRWPAAGALAQQIVDILTRGRRDGSFRQDLDPRAAATCSWVR